MKFSTSSRIGGSVLVAVVAFLVMSTQGAGAQTAWTCNGLAATLVGTPGPDTLRGTAGVDVIVGREGNDVITGLGGDDIVCAGKGDDTIFGGDGFDIIFAAQGNDTIYAADGSTTATRADSKGARMFGGAGNDIIHGSNKWDRMQGGLGVDTLFGYEGRDWMRAGAGNDTVDGGAAIDDLHGGNGADVIEVTAGDMVRGGAGLDTCNLAGEPGLFRSCGRDQVEATAPTVTPTPPVTTTTTTVAPTTTTTAAVAPTAATVVITSCDASAETVGIKNTGSTSINLAGWTLHDVDVNFSADLREVTLAPGETVVMVSGPNGVGGPGRVVWSDRHIWNNDGDVATLLKPDGSRASFLSC